MNRLQNVTEYTYNDVLQNWHCICQQLMASIALTILIQHWNTTHKGTRTEPNRTTSCSLPHFSHLNIFVHRWQDNEPYYMIHVYYRSYMCAESWLCLRLNSRDLSHLFLPLSYSCLHSKRAKRTNLMCVCEKTEQKKEPRKDDSGDGDGRTYKLYTQ